MRFSNFTNKTEFLCSRDMIPCGLVARIRRFHRRGRGSIPRKGETVILAEFVIPEKPCFKSDKKARWNLIDFLAYGALKYFILTNT